MTPAEIALANLAGFCANEIQTIAINPTHGAAVQRLTLLHELMHAAFYAAGIEGALDEEKVCRGLEGPMLQIIQNNPALMAALATSKPLRL